MPRGVKLKKKYIARTFWCFVTHKSIQVVLVQNILQFSYILPCLALLNMNTKCQSNPPLQYVNNTKCFARCMHGKLIIMTVELHLTAWLVIRTHTLKRTHSRALHAKCELEVDTLPNPLGWIEKTMTTAFVNIITRKWDVLIRCNWREHSSSNHDTRGACMTARAPRN